MPLLHHPSHEQQTVTVSRSALFQEDAHFRTDDEKLAELNELLKANWGDIEVSPKRKRRKVVDLVDRKPVLHGKVEPAPFRLLSIAHPPRMISLEARPLPARTVWEPPCEDTEREAELRTQQALSVAVEFISLFESAQAYLNPLQKADKVIHASADVPLSPLAFFLAEIPRQEGFRPSRMLHKFDTRPSPHEVVVKGDTLPVISLKRQGNKQTTTHSKCKRKRRRRIIERPYPTFWRGIL
ncbi:hypothetical protein B0F90DRAFT_1306255 [Multifurca ochricompacta]|uniref:Uncharacterized protein n=1 Tax=Multifurca ochricompacta TaxID=376703 RepID=A0AAD4M6B8_9AGAM|nr:hypothetical protein B0F90DRAFT_1306255 [Multifurca ochricompacta]